MNWVWLAWAVFGLGRELYLGQFVILNLCDIVGSFKDLQRFHFCVFAGGEAGKEVRPGWHSHAGFGHQVR